MSTTYAGNPDNFPTSITIPSDGDGPGIKAADVNAAFEGLADRTESLYRRGIRTYKLLTALAPLTGADAVTDDLVFIPYYGLYVFLGGAATGYEDGLMAIRADDDSGSWISQYLLLLRGEEGNVYAATNGLPYMRSGKIATQVVKNATVAAYHTAPLASDFSTSSGSFVDAQATAAIAVETGDLVEVRFCGILFTADASRPAGLQLVVTDGNGSIYTPASVQGTSTETLAVGNHRPFTGLFAFTAAGTGNMSAKIQVRTTVAGGFAEWLAGAQITVNVVRA